jgi:hypothetical protein
MEFQNQKRMQPPRCPRSTKASGLPIPRFSPSRLSSYKNYQRLDHQLPTQTSSGEVSPIAQPPLPKPRGTAPVASTSPRDIQQKEYQQYSRKNYLRRCKAEGQFESDLAGGAPQRNKSSENTSRYKSKSALEYAKYFIKQVSNIPTDPSSAHSVPQQHQEPVSSSKTVPSTNSGVCLEQASEREHSRNRNRSNLMKKLRSLKNTRSRSNKQGSVSR